MGWLEVEGRFVSTLRVNEEDLRKECAWSTGYSEDYIDMQVHFLDDCTSAHDYVKAIEEKNEQILQMEDEDYDREYESIDYVYITRGREVVAQDVKFIETYSVPTPDFIKNDLDCKKQLIKTSKNYVIYDNINDKKLFGDTLEECVDYAIENVKRNRDKSSMIYIANRRFSKCTLVTAVSERFDGNNYKNIPNKQYVQNLYEYEYAGNIHI